MATDKRKIAFYLPDDLEEEFRRLIKDDRRSITAVLTLMVEEYVAAAKAKHKAAA